MATEDKESPLKKQHILILDNFDSFTYNLLHYIEEFEGISCDVIRNDVIELSQLSLYDAIILSPGPGIPEEAGKLLTVINHIYQTKKMLGVCLGLQGIVVALGGSLKQLDEVMHGLERDCTIVDNSDPLFKGISNKFSAGRYHSWVADKNNLPEELLVTAIDDQNNIMAIRHKKFPVYAVQFHPESVMTPSGKEIIRNWLDI